jgi:hypothetical protein
VPHADPEQPSPEILQLTPKEFDPVTVAVNCCGVPVTSSLLVGEIEISKPVINVTWAEADLVGSAFDVAVTVTILGIGIDVGAVYSPAAVITPQELPPQPAPDTFQVTVVFALPETWAVNCCCRVPGASETELGDTLTETTADADVAKATSAHVRARNRRSR